MVKRVSISPSSSDSSDSPQGQQNASGSVEILPPAPNPPVGGIWGADRPRPKTPVAPALSYVQWLTDYCEDLGSQSISNGQPRISHPGINSMLPCNPNEFTMQGRLRPRVLLCGDTSLELYKAQSGTTTCAAYLNSKLKPIKATVSHSYEGTLVKLRDSLLEHVSSHSVALVSYSLRDLCLSKRKI